jgi:hypothetical protein
LNIGEPALRVLSGKDTTGLAGNPAFWHRSVPAARLPREASGYHQTVCLTLAIKRSIDRVASSDRELGNLGCSCLFPHEKLQAMREKRPGKSGAIWQM